MNDPDASPTERIDEERDEQGGSTGVELEHDGEPQAAGIIDQPFDPDKIDVTTRNPTIDLLLSRIRNGAIDLEPDFQRKRGIWTDQRQSRLIESLLLRIPLPTLYAAEDEYEDWAIVDGIQRLTAIVRFMDPDLLKARPLRLSGLEYLGGTYANASYSSLPGRLQTRLRETELVLHLIRSGTPEEVKYNIFARINTGGMPLSAQELRHALIAGPIRLRLKKLAESEAFQRATGGSIKDDRMADREMVLRFLAFRMRDPMQYSSQDFNEFLRRAMREANGLSESKWRSLEKSFYEAMDRAHQVFGTHAFRKRFTRDDYRYPINKALYDAVSVNLSHLSVDEANKLVKRPARVQSVFFDLMRDYRFMESISQGTGDIAKVRRRFALVQEAFEEVIKK